MDQLSVDEREILLRVARERTDTKAFIRDLHAMDLARLKRVAFDVYDTCLGEQGRRQEIARKAQGAAKKKDA
jgi:hypothetical protein